MVWAKGPNGRQAANLAEGCARSGARWLTPAGTTLVRLARGCLLPCLDLLEFFEEILEFLASIFLEFFLHVPLGIFVAERKKSLA